MDLVKKIIERAKSDKQRIVLPEATEERTLRAADRVLADDVADIQMEEVVSIAKAHNVHPAIICLKWAVQRGQIPIPFSIHENEYVSNLQSTVEDPLTDEEMETLRKADKNCRLIKGQVFLWPGATSWHDLWDEDGTITQ